MTQSLNRRQMLVSTGAAAACAFLGTGRRVMAAAPKAVIHETKVISCQPAFYHGWPTVARCKSGELLLVYSGGREGHVRPFGRVELMVLARRGKDLGLATRGARYGDRRSRRRRAGNRPRHAPGDHLHLALFREPAGGGRKDPCRQAGAWPADRLHAGRLPTTGSMKPSARQFLACGCSAPPTAGSPGGPIRLCK